MFSLEELFLPETRPRWAFMTDPDGDANRFSAGSSGPPVHDRVGIHSLPRFRQRPPGSNRRHGTAQDRVDVAGPEGR